MERKYSIFCNQIKASQQAREYDKKASARELNVGDVVRWYRPAVEVGRSAKLARQWVGPYQVIERIGKVNYLLMDEAGDVAKTLAHINDLKPVQETYDLQSAESQTPAIK